MGSKKEMRLYKFLYLLGYEMVEVDQVINSNAIDVIYSAKHLFDSTEIRSDITKVRFRVMNAETELRLTNRYFPINTYAELLNAERILDGR